MNTTFEFREAQNLDEAVRSAFVAAGYEADAEYANQQTLIESGLTRAEADNDADAIQLWQNVLLAHKASEPKGEKEIRQIASAAGSMLAAAGVGKYDAAFTVTVTVDDGDVSVSVKRGPGGLIVQSGTGGAEVVINPDAGGLGATGLGN